jgi:UDPglucose 6-dehydrogenase
MHIAVIGTGYVGLVTGACFAEFGVEVTCVDVVEEKINKLNEGIIPIYEPGLDKIVEKNTRAGRLHFTTDIKSAVEQALVVFLAVGTPPREDGSPDMSYYRQAAKDIAEAMNGYKVLVTKSTVPVGTGKWLREFVSENLKVKTNFGVASNPEFLREGAANAFLATKITFINEIANLCDAIGCDVHDVARGMGMDNRIGRKFLHPGPGYGGSCFPKDTRAFTKVGDKYGIDTLVVDAVIKANDLQRQAMLPKIERLVGDLNGKQIGVLGLSFKPETDDMRESPAIDIIKEMQNRGARVKAFDPVAMDEAKHCLPDIEYAADEYEAIRDADALVIITEWNQFRALDLEKIKQLLKAPKIADLRNIYEPKDMLELGFEYIGVGR